MVNVYIKNQYTHYISYLIIYKHSTKKMTHMFYATSLAWDNNLRKKSQDLLTRRLLDFSKASDYGSFWLYSLLTMSARISLLSQWR